VEWKDNHCTFLRDSRWKWKVICRKMPKFLPSHTTYFGSFSASSGTHRTGKGASKNDVNQSWTIFDPPLLSVTLCHKLGYPLYKWHHKWLPPSSSTPSFKSKSFKKHYSLYRSILINNVRSHKSCFQKPLTTTCMWRGTI
jgi:hypothetical protein